MAKKSQIVKSEKKPKFSTRVVRRCFRCGRRRGYIRDFSLCRICFREMANEGLIPGVKKSSWWYINIMITDPIADMINRIKNAQAVSKSTVKVPYSNLKYEVVKILEKMKWIDSVEKKGKKTNKTIEITLKYSEGRPAITNIRKISKPGQRIYVSVNKIKKIRDGFGMSIVSTSRGLMTNIEARRENLGGEILVEVY